MRIILSMYQQHRAAVLSYLPPSNSATRWDFLYKSLFDGFAKIDGKLVEFQAGRFLFFLVTANESLACTQHHLHFNEGTLTSISCFYIYIYITKCSFSYMYKGACVRCVFASHCQPCSFISDRLQSASSSWYMDSETVRHGRWEHSFKLQIVELC